VVAGLIPLQWPLPGPGPCFKKEATHHQSQLWGHPIGSGLVMRGFYCTMHARHRGHVHVGQSAGKATLGSVSQVCFSGTLASSGVLQPPNPPTPRPQSWGPGGFKPSRRVPSLPLFSLYHRLAPVLGRPAADRQLPLPPGPVARAAQPRGMPVSRVRYALRKKNFILGQAHGISRPP
jgi:hypothetical protein